MVLLSEYSSQINIPVERLLKKDNKLALQRQVYWYYLRNKHHYKLRDIAILFGRKHSTIISGIRTISNLIETKNSTIDPYLEALHIFSFQEE